MVKIEDPEGKKGREYNYFSCSILIISKYFKIHYSVEYLHTVSWFQDC